MVRDLHNNLLGLTAITGLHLIQRVNATHQDSADILKRFPKVFNGLRTLGGDYTIRLKEDAHLFALYTPRRVPFSLRSQVQDELSCMEAQGVILKVKDPHSLVCWHGGGAKENRSHENLCRFETTQ